MCRNSGDPRTALVSVRALLMQVAYPMVDAGVGRIRQVPRGADRGRPAAAAPRASPGMGVHRFVSMTNPQLRLLKRLRVR